MFDLFILKDKYGDYHLMSSSRICKRVMKDSSKSDYNWITSAAELIRICNKKNFPEDKAISIKVAVLNCYSSLLVNALPFGIMIKTDLESVYFAYNSLYNVKDEKVTKARINFLLSFLEAVITSEPIFPFSISTNFIDIEKQWKKEKINELIKLEQINFDSLFSLLQKDFNNLVSSLQKDSSKETQDLYEDHTFAKKEEDMPNYIVNVGVDDYEIGADEILQELELPVKKLTKVRKITKKKDNH